MIQGTKLLVVTLNIFRVFRRHLELIHDLSPPSRFNRLMQTAKVGNNYYNYLFWIELILNILLEFDSHAA